VTRPQLGEPRRGMLVVFRARGLDWARFASTLDARRADLLEHGCSLVEAHRNRNHPDEWIMLQYWPDKATFDRFARGIGPSLDREAGVDWTDVSTWETAGTMPA